MFVVALGGCATAYTRGEAALRAGHPEEALPLLEQACAETPAHLDARIALGIARYRTRGWNAATDILAAVVAEMPRSADARLFLALAQLMSGDVIAARADLEALRELHVHPRVDAQITRVLPLLRAPLDDAVRDVIAGDLDDAYEWMREVEAARRRGRALLEPAWSVVWDHGPVLHPMPRLPVPTAP
jgi:hypothetical protein